MADYVDELLAEVGTELRAAMQQFGPMSSSHEGWAVLWEEVDELWDEVRANDPVRARREAVQVAAMAVRFLHDVSDGRARQRPDMTESITDLPHETFCAECGEPIVRNRMGSDADGDYGGAGTARMSWCHVAVPEGNGHRAVCGG